MNGFQRAKAGHTSHGAAGYDSKTMNPRSHRDDTEKSVILNPLKGDKAFRCSTGAALWAEASVAAAVAVCPAAKKGKTERQKFPNAPSPLESGLRMTNMPAVRSTGVQQTQNKEWLKLVCSKPHTLRGRAA